MAKVTFRGLQEYEQQLSKLETGVQEIAEKAVYEGARIVADEVKKKLSSLKSVSSQASVAAYSKKTPTYITEKAKSGLIQSFGISSIRNDNGFYNVKIGFDGYNDVKTKQYPKGQPNNLIARACESGSSAMIKQPFMRTAVNASKGEAERKMAEILANEIKKKMEE